MSKCLSIILVNVLSPGDWLFLIVLFSFMFDFWRKDSQPYHVFHAAIVPSYHLVICS